LRVRFGEFLSRYLLHSPHPIHILPPPTPVCYNVSAAAIRIRSSFRLFACGNMSHLEIDGGIKLFYRLLGPDSAPHKILMINGNTLVASIHSFIHQCINATSVEQLIALYYLFSNCIGDGN
jgi:hypothetical protein